MVYVHVSASVCLQVVHVYNYQLGKQVTAGCKVAAVLVWPLVARLMLLSHSSQRSAPSASYINLWSTSLARQQSDNSAAAQPLIGIKRHTPKEFGVKLWL